MKKLNRVFALLLVVMLMMTACGTSTQPELEDEIDREIDVYFEGYSEMGGVINVTELDLDGSTVESAYGGIGILAAEGETIGNALEHAGYSDLQPVLEGDTFEGWMEVQESVVIDEYGFEECVREIVSDKIYTTEELLELTVSDTAVTYIAKWANIPVESYFEPIDAWETDDVTTSGAFAFSANGGIMRFMNADGVEYEWAEYGYWLENGQALNDIMGTADGDALIGIEKDGAEFLGWTLYQADSTFLSEELVEEEGILCFPYESIYYSGYTLLKNPVLVGEQMPTEQLCGMSLLDTNYYAVAEWSESGN